MSARTFKYFTVANPGTPQPLIGTTLGALINPTAGQQSILVADSSMFVVGDYALILEADGTKAERQLVTSVPDGTHITVAKVENAHASGAWVSLGRMANTIYVQPKPGNTGILYIGNSRVMVKATGVGMILLLEPVAAGVQPIELNMSRQGPANIDDVSDVWIDADNNVDKYLPSFGLV